MGRDGIVVVEETGKQTKKNAVVEMVYTSHIITYVTERYCACSVKNELN